MAMATQALELEPLKVGILGATGMVGQRFIILLASHPFFQIHALGASFRSVGRTYAQAVRWKQSEPIPDAVRNKPVQLCEPQHFRDCAFVFSGLDSDVAGDVEREFRLSEIPVFSNAKNYRQNATVPLVVPLVNPDHLNIIPTQRAVHNLVRGFIVTNANCSTTGLVVPLRALEHAFGPIDKCIVTTMQAISGGGYPGVPSLDILDNIVPYIPDEEPKMESEAAKILGGMTDNHQAFDLRHARPIAISAACNRVPVLEGHTACVSVHFVRRPPPTPARAAAVLAAYACAVQAEGCPSAPTRAITVHDAPDRPQPRLDRDFQRGAGVHVGRVRVCPVLDLKFVVMSNNVAIGAATSSIINAEYAVLKGFLDMPMPEEILHEA